MISQASAVTGAPGAPRCAPKIVSRHAATGAPTWARRAITSSGGDQLSEWRASITRLAAITEPHVYARNDP